MSKKHSPAPVVPPMPSPVAWGIHTTEVAGPNGEPMPAIAMVFEHVTGKTVFFIDSDSASQLAGDLAAAVQKANVSGLTVVKKPGFVIPGGAVDGAGN